MGRNQPPWHAPRPRHRRLERASRITSPSASTISRARRRTSPLHRRSPRRSRLPNGRGAGPAGQHLLFDGRPLLAGARLPTDTPSCSRRRSRSTGTRSRRAGQSNGGGAAALFNFDHSEFEASLGRTTPTSRRPLAASPASRSRRRYRPSRPAPGADRGRRADGVLRQLPAPPAGPAGREDRHRHLSQSGQHPEALAHGRGHAPGRATRLAAPIR